MPIMSSDDFSVHDDACEKVDDEMPLSSLPDEVASVDDLDCECGINTVQFPKSGLESTNEPSCARGRIAGPRRSKGVFYGYRSVERPGVVTSCCSCVRTLLSGPALNCTPDT